MSAEYVFTLPQRDNVDNEEDDWDRYSENIRPTRRGRKIDVLKKKATETVTEVEAREKLDELLKDLESVEDEQHIDKILTFCQWFETSLPIGSHKLYYEFLWKIIIRDGFLDKFGNSGKMLKIWEKMADNSAGHAHDIYQFAISRKSLLTSAALYVRWSQHVELAGAPVEARRVLILAKTNCAVPIEAINDAEDQLEMREMRRLLNEKSSDEESDEEFEEQRQAFTNLAVLDEKHTVPIVRIPSIAADPTKKSMKFDDNNIMKVGTSSKNNSVQPFEVFAYADADDVEYLRNVHELGTAHIERYAIRESNPKLQEASVSDEIRIVPTSSTFEVWTVEGSTKNSEKQPKARMTIKRIFKDISIEEYVVSLLPNIPSLNPPIARTLNFDDTL
ncbi:unnamed protein product [Caenorhabditis angaria]|uniref:BUB1 N-terminal domain-containing protein n=1 Tax=Caenorhabditis angaria TaxID=860376 RepID=A0A9P1I5V5_9PELO|nr:unnamed protein product [Caenorhabditis angaria]